MGLIDQVDLSLLDIDLTPDQIQMVQMIIAESGAAMFQFMFQRFEEEGFTQEQVLSIVRNIFGTMMKPEHVQELDAEMDVVFGEEK